MSALNSQRLQNSRHITSALAGVALEHRCPGWEVNLTLPDHDRTPTCTPCLIISRSWPHFWCSRWLSRRIGAVFLPLFLQTGVCTVVTNARLATIRSTCPACSEEFVAHAVDMMATVRSWPVHGPPSPRPPTYPPNVAVLDSPHPAAWACNITSNAATRPLRRLFAAFRRR